MQNPRMLTVTIANNNTNYQLSALLAALDSSFADAVYTRAARLHIQADVHGGSAKYYIGNSDMTSSSFGRELVATQLQDIGTADLGIVDLSAVYLRTDTDSATFNIIVEFA